jgi:hypothetical protein
MPESRTGIDWVAFCRSRFGRGCNQMTNPLRPFQIRGRPVQSPHPLLFFVVDQFCPVCAFLSGHRELLGSNL